MDPAGAAAGGLIAMCVAIGLPLALVCHALSGRSLPLSVVLVPIVSTLAIFVLHLLFDAHSNEAVRSLGASLAWWSIWPTSIVSLIAAMPVVIFRLVRRRWPAKPSINRLGGGVRRRAR